MEVWDTVKKYGKRDGNHDHIKHSLKKIGCSVADTADMGDGFPDLVVGCRGINYLFEVKDPAASNQRRKLTPDQRVFFEGWRGQVHKIETVTDAMDVMGITTGANNQGDLWQQK